MKKAVILFFVISVLGVACAPEQSTKQISKTVDSTSDNSPKDPILANPDYTLWHTGKFYYRERPTGTFLVNRTDSIQEEFIKTNGMIVEFDISWKNDSMYTMKYNKLSENPYDGELAEGIENLVKECKITRVTNWHYVEEARSNLSDSIIYTRIYRYR